MILTSLSAFLSMPIIEIMPIFHNDRSNTIIYAGNEKTECKQVTLHFQLKTAHFHYK